MQRRAVKAAERIRLVGPVELAGPARIAVELVLGPLVVAQNRFDLVGVVHIGDIIYCGTPENVGPVVRGDVIEIHIDRLPNLSVKIV
jgi:2-keto-4-pentenoate hydratase